MQRMMSTSRFSLSTAIILFEARRRPGLIFGVSSMTWRPLSSQPDTLRKTSRRTLELCLAQSAEQLRDDLGALLRVPFLPAFVINVCDAEPCFVPLCPFEIARE